MQIEEWEGASAFWSGIKGANNWVASLGGEAKKIAKAVARGLKVLNPSKFLAGVTDFIGKGAKALKKGYSFLREWFEEDPWKATAGIVGGGLAIGALVLSGGAIVGTLGAGVAALGKAGLAIKAAVAGGFVVGALPTIKELGGAMVKASVFLYDFDWNISDQTIRDLQKSYWESFVQQSGQLLGEATGSIVCSAHPGIGSVKVDYDLIAHVWQLLDKDARVRALGALTSLAEFTRDMALYLTFLETFKNARDWIQANIRTGIGRIDKAIEAWGEESSGSWVFAEKIEEIREKVDQTTLGKFGLNFLDGLLSSCFDFSPIG